MTPEIGLVLAILAASLVLFVSEWLRMDVVALLVLMTLALTGLVGPGEALAGFSNPAVVTVWAMFMLSAGLTHTGVADAIGRQVLRLSGSSEPRIIAVIMLTSGVLSAFMSNIGVAALMLPVVMDIARRTGKPPSRLLMPLAYGTLLGGLTTLIGTPPNLLVSEELTRRGLPAFGLFDFTPVGGAAMVGGVAFVALVGRHLLPRGPSKKPRKRRAQDLRTEYALEERTVVLRLAAGSRLVGKSLRESHLGSAAGLNVLAVIRRDGKSLLAPGSETLLHAGDRLLVGGVLDRFLELQSWRELTLERSGLELGQLWSDSVGLAEVRLRVDSTLIGQTLGQAGFRHRFGLIVLALRRDALVSYSGLTDEVLSPGDVLLVQGERPTLAELARADDVDSCRIVTPADLDPVYGISGQLFEVRVPDDSRLVGQSLEQSRLGDAFGLGVLGIRGQGRTRLMPSPDERIEAGDRLIVRGKRVDLEGLRGLQQLEPESESGQQLEGLESEQIGLVEAILSPRSLWAGKTLREIHFRERFGVQAVALMREGISRRSNLREFALRFGDALLLFGRRDRLMLLAEEPNLIVLARSIRQPPRTARAPWAVAIMAAVLLPVLLGWLPISIAAVSGATLMVLCGCMNMEEAYRAVEWRGIFLIAGMLPLGTAMNRTGAASWLAELVLETAGGLGPWGVVFALYLVTAAATMIIPTAALVVLMAPIAIKASNDLGISPQSTMMAVAMAASASFTSPISHPANVLVMGPGGYRFVDYLKLGVPLTLVVLVIVALVLPWLWPL